MYSLEFRPKATALYLIAPYRIASYRTASYPIVRHLRMLYRIVSSLSLPCRFLSPIGVCRDAIPTRCVTAALFQPTPLLGFFAGVVVHKPSR